jgi:hypothetical protein
MEEEHTLKDLIVKNRTQVELTQTSMERSSLCVSKLAMANSHIRYCGLVRGPYVEEESLVVCLDT